MLDFVQFISDNTGLSVEEKVAMLDDFCASFGVAGTAGEKKEFTNKRITKFIAKSINRARRRAVAITEFGFESG